MKNALLVASVALAVLGGIPAAAPAMADSLSVTIGNNHPTRHWWWHHRWYDTQPVGYHYVAPPYPYEHPYWRAHWKNSHHCRDWDKDGDCH